jgi:SAM-dependent methyltransferase
MFLHFEEEIEHGFTDVTNFVQVTGSSMIKSSSHGTLVKLAAERRKSLNEVPTIDMLHELAARFSNGSEFPATEEGLAVGKLLYDHLHSLTNIHNNRFSMQRLADYCQAFIRTRSSNPPPVEGMTWVEMGSGSQNPLAFLFLVLLLGARQCVAIDIEPIQDMRKACRALADVAATMLLHPLSITETSPDPHMILNRMKTFDMAKLRSGNEEGIDQSLLTHLCCASESVSLPDGYADVVMSNSFLEHVEDLDAVVREMARITKPGGLGIHGVDGTDHGRYSDPAIGPLDFLKEPGGTRMVGGCNRIRPLVMVEYFLANDFEFLEWETWDEIALAPDDIETFAEPFRSMTKNVLQTASGYLCVRRRQPRSAKAV